MTKSNEIFNNLEKVAQEIKARRIELNSQLSKTDKEITDLQHYIELYPLNACQGYKIAKMLKDCLVKRRAIKDEAEELERISQMSVGFVGNGKGRAVLARIKDKRYHPRVLTELFEDSPTTNRREGTHEIPR